MSTIRLDYFVGHAANRDNNFNLIRMLAALAVLFSHSFALAIGSSLAEPLQRALGKTPGAIAVDVFFLTSGFLITGSLLARENIKGFTYARVLRIFPAQFVGTVITVLLIGLYFTSASSSAFFFNIETLTYFIRNIILVTGVQHELPGAFENNPWQSAVNAPLWTLPYELAMYALLVVVWRVSTPWRVSSEERLRVICVAIAIIGIAFHVAHYEVISHNVVRLTAMFFSGATFYLYRKSIPLNRSIFLCALLILVCSTTDRRYFQIFYPLTMPYIVIYLAFVPGGFLRKYNKLGDYSYGTYIYAWPTQQMIVASVSGISVVGLAVTSLLGTLFFAITSWHLVERQALTWKSVRLSKSQDMSPVDLKGN